MKKTKAFCIWLGITLTLPLSAATIHVPGDQPTIQAGIDAAVDGDTVLVADGTWTGPGNRDIDFLGKAVTVRSENGREACTIDCEGNSSNLHRAFLLVNGEGPGSVIQGFTIIDGYHTGDGGAIHASGSSPRILDNAFISNVSWDSGGAIRCGGTTLIKGNIFEENFAIFDYGGAVFLQGGSVLLENNIIENNTADYGGGGIACRGGTPTFVNNLIRNNEQYEYDDLFKYYGGGGIAIYNGCSAELINCTLAANLGEIYGGGILVADTSSLVCRNAIFWNNTGGITPRDDIEYHAGATVVVAYTNIEDGWPGPGNLSLDPLFINGPGGPCYLKQEASGQSETSPCVDAGAPQSAPIDGTTRTDEWPDTGVNDMGFHYPTGGPDSWPGVAVGLGPSPENPPRIRIFPPEQNAARIVAFQAYGFEKYGVNVSVGDLDGDRVDELLTGPGPCDTFGPHVRGFSAAGGPFPGLSFLAYGTSKYGVNVAAGDFDGDGFDEIITGPGAGAVFGPHVRGWNYDGTGSVIPVSTVNFFAYGTPKWGVNVACGDIDGDGMDEIVTGAGPGPIYGAHVRGWNVDDAPATAIPGVSFFAYNTPRYGVRVSCGDIDGDGIDELVTAPGPSPAFGAHVRGWNYDGDTLGEIQGVSFFAWPPDQARHGATIFAGADLDEDGRDELVVGAGPDPTLDTLVRVYAFDGTETTLSFSLQAFPDGWTYGASVTAGRF